MALQIHSPTSFTTTNKPYHLHHLYTIKSKLTIIKSQNTPTNTESGAPKNPKPSSNGLGFGSSSSSSSTSSKSNATPGTKKKKPKSKRERAAVIRRPPVENPRFISEENVAKSEELMKNENAFLLTWLGIGGVILVQGITLAASGFLPEDVDKFFVKYLYPTFTPTVLFFVAGTVAYGVLKYLQNEKLNQKN